MVSVDDEIEILIKEITERLGKQDPTTQKYSAKFGVLVRDDRIAQKLEGLVMTCRSGKKKKKLDYKGEMLMMGISDDVDIIVL